MALYFNNGTANGSKLLRSSSYLNQIASFTIAGWYYQGPTTPTGGTSRVLVNIGDDARSSSYIFLGSEANVADLIILVSDGTTVHKSPTYQPSTGQWIYCALRYNVTTHIFDLVVNGNSVIALQQDVTSFSWPTLHDLIGSSWGDLGVIYRKAWQAYLSLDELVDEQNAYFPVRTANLISDARLTAINDLSDFVTTPTAFTLTTAAHGVSTVTGPYSLTSRQVIPSGSLIFTGDGKGVDGASANLAMLNYLPTGVALGQPLTQPRDGPGNGFIGSGTWVGSGWVGSGVLGSGVGAIACLFPSGRIVTIGGGAPNFPNTGIGIYNPDLTIWAEGLKQSGNYPKMRTIARDLFNYWYGTDGTLLFQYDFNGNPTQTWNLNTIVTPSFNCLVIAVNSLGTIAYVVGSGVSMLKIYKIDLVHSMSSLFLDLTSWFATAAVVCMFCRSGGNLVVAVNTGPGPNNNGFVREYTPTAVQVADYDIGSNSNSRTNISPVWVTPDPNNDYKFWTICDDLG